MNRPGRLGVNHHLLFPASMDSPEVHEATLPEALAYQEFDAIDFFCAGDSGQRKREAAQVRASGKHPVYNCPLLYQVPGCNPNACDPGMAGRTRQAALPHLDAAADAGAELINIASGPVPPDDFAGEAWSGWLDFLEWFAREAGSRSLTAIIEPFDWTIGKGLLIGPTRDAVHSVEKVRRRGANAVALMIDMGHLPIMGESFADAIQLSMPYLLHVHLGNAVIGDPSHPLYGDNHPPLSIPEGEHDETHLVEFLFELAQAGYLDNADATLTLEMRPYEGATPAESVARWVRMFDDAWEQAHARI